MLAAIHIAHRLFGQPTDYYCFEKYPHSIVLSTLFNRSWPLLQVPNLRQRFKRSVQDMNTSNELLTALEHGDIGDVCSSLVDCPRGIASALNTPSLSVKHKLRTPLMVAAMTGDIAKWTATLDAFNQQFANKVRW